jgi:hypothetical protein
MGRQERCIQGFWRGYIGERDHLENVGVYWRIILKWMFKKWNGESWTVLIWLRMGTVGRYL